jgi:hypothetical protein
MVKLTDCDFAIYGGLDAKLEHFSADTITGEGGEGYYLIKVRTVRDYPGSSEGSLRIIPGNDSHGGYSDRRKIGSELPADAGTPRQAISTPRAIAST